MTQLENDIRSLRIASGMAQKELALKSGIKIALLKRFERGFEVPSTTEAKSISKALGVMYGDIIAAHEALQISATPGEGYTTVKADGNSLFPRQEQPSSKKFKVLDLFCGCGGFSYGFEQTNRFAVTAGVDLLEDRVDSFLANHPYAVGVRGDIRGFTSSELSDLAENPDVIIGGPPCQGFSSIRPFRNLTEGDPRNTLLEEFVITVEEIKPKWFVFENVVGLLTHKKGEAFDALLRGFEEIGYTCDWRVINMALLGLPQVRERLIIVGSLDGSPFEWPQPTHEHFGRTMAGKAAKRLTVDPLFQGLLEPSVTVEDAIGDLPPIESGQKCDEYFPNNHMTNYSRMMRKDAEGLSLHEATRHSEKMMEIIRLSGTNRNALPEGLTTSGFSSCYSRLEGDKPSVTLTVNFVHPSSNRCIHPEQHRALTPREGARIQGFPDRFVFCGSRAQIVKQIGNAVPPLLGEAIAASLARSLDQAHARKSSECVHQQESDPFDNISVSTG